MKHFLDLKAKANAAHQPAGLQFGSANAVTEQVPGIGLLWFRHWPRFKVIKIDFVERKRVVPGFGF